MSIPEIIPGFIRLERRGSVRVGGGDAGKFLQNIVTSDLNRLDEDGLQHSCLLTAQGKFLHDFFVSKTEDGYLLDCEGGDRAKDLGRLLTFYRLRAQVTIDVREHQDVFSVFGRENFYDPRHPRLGSRIFSKPSLPEHDFKVWDELRISLAVADGSRDAEIGKSTLAELNMESSAIDYTKGCYIGQELTARIHHRGLAKRHLFPVRFASCAPAFGAGLFHAGRSIGEMRSSSGRIGLALLKDEFLPPLQEGYYQPDSVGNTGQS